MREYLMWGCIIICVLFLFIEGLYREKTDNNANVVISGIMSAVWYVLLLVTIKFFNLFT